MFRSFVPGRTTPDLARRGALGAILVGTAAAMAGCSVRRQVPAVGFTLLDGTPSSTVDLRGQVVLMNFWATTCAACVRKMPQFIELHARYGGQGLATVAVAMPWDPPASVSHFAQTRRLPFGVVIDTQGLVARAFGDVTATPTSFLIDRRGKVAHRHTGEHDFAALGRQIERLLDEV
ncbi:MAG: TlpA family protein disulfide reductase [Pseudomonadota bacterium]|jgi:peroxiredoxin|nr:TlpA family protein disulfide reductase [Rubrivivax sp.]MCA3259303.1 TlpA family protein disulfide reductase [Rubrivivax sp.]MCE2913725.1 TlpA family protein disulfide reductase [Rubrivivax sp.]MCZ8031302.1 TlpA disulfide reductase family protein [Rubrivivax sp.]